MTSLLLVTLLTAVGGAPTTATPFERQPHHGCIRPGCVGETCLSCYRPTPGYGDYNFRILFDYSWTVRQPPRYGNNSTFIRNEQILLPQPLESDAPEVNGERSNQLAIPPAPVTGRAAPSGRILTIRKPVISRH